MNSLSNDFYIGYKVQTILFDGHHMPYYIEFTELEQSQLWLKPVKHAVLKSDRTFEPVRAKQPINGVQGSLYGYF